MKLTRVSVVWRIGFLIVFGAILGAFMTIAIITKRLETGDVITIGKIKIKNASQIEIPFVITPNNEKPLTRKEKRELRKNK